jgi:endoglycosylceramidase
VILDMHQDLFHRMYCGEGVPDYVYEICEASKADTVKPFPAPLGEPMPTDETGAPALDSCLERDFFTYYFTAEVSHGFQCLYDNTEGLWDHLSNMWKTVAEYFKDQENVLGYEIINEPWVCPPVPICVWMYGRVCAF